MPSYSWRSWRARAVARWDRSHVQLTQLCGPVLLSQDQYTELANGHAKQAKVGYYLNEKWREQIKAGSGKLGKQIAFLFYFCLTMLTESFIGT